MSIPFHRLQLIPFLAAAIALTACDTSKETAQETLAGGSIYQAEILRTDYGVAHITAADYGSLGYGEGYAAAEDHVCNIARGLLEARGELARVFGPGKNDANLLSDAIVRAMDMPGQARSAMAAQEEENRQWLEGYAAGYNRYLADEGPSATSWCADAAWVQAATATDFMARMVLLAQTLPRLSAAIAAAQPPDAAQLSSNGEPAPGAEPVAAELLAQAADAVDLKGMGSNAWALGSERSENGRGLLLANPHYPWYGGNRFWEKHLTIPGKLDVYGVHLLGTPGVAIGFNDAVAWSHTVSDSERVVFYRLRLVPGQPTRYHYDGEIREMRTETVSIPVRQPDGSSATVERTVYFSHYGPILAFPGMSWDSEFAYSARDANANNYALMSQWKAMNEASDLEQFIEAHRHWNAMPWVNTMAASADGRALYLDNSTVGDLSDEAIALWQQQLGGDSLAAGLFAQRGWVLLDGSDSRFEWQDDNGAPLPGTVPFERRPQLERRDFIFNSNDSYWLTNPAAPMAGYSPLYGPVDSARSLRTRMNMLLLAPDSPYGYAGPDGRFSRRDIQDALFGNRGLTAELLLGPLVGACRETPLAEWEDQAVDLAPACDALAAYDGQLNEDSRGAVLFREWLGRFGYAETLRSGTLFAQDFDPRAPVSTPSGLADPELARQHLAGALKVLEEAGLPPDAPLGMAQFAYRAGQGIPVHGGNSYEGVANLQISDIPEHPVAGVEVERLANSRLATTAGYPIVHGSSYILTLSFTDEGPAGEALMSYSQSGDPGSEHFTDQTRLYREKQWRPVLFEREAVEANTLSRLELTGPKRASD